MNNNMLTLDDPSYPEILRNIPSAPKQLYVVGPLAELLSRPRLAVVGSRKVTIYGKQVTTRLAGEAAKQGIVIVSGLALGVDGLAHQAALDAGGLTIAVLPSSIERIYPATHHQLAKRIVESGGVLVSEYPPSTDIFKGNFVARNRLISGLSNATLITEAALKSGSLHTARFALEQGHEVLAVPGNINTLTSEGANNLIKHGAIPVTCIDDILFTLGVKSTQPKAPAKGSNEAEDVVLQLLSAGQQDGEALQSESRLDIALFNQTLTMLEITGKIRSLGVNQWALA